MRIDVVTIFPEYLGPLDLSLIGRARAEGLLEVVVHDLRDHTHDRHRTVDDTPYGGGAGMVMRPEPWGEAVDAVMGVGTATDTVATDRAVDPLVVVPTPSGQPFTQSVAAELATESRLVFLCGRYEGIDRRVVEDTRSRYRLRELSLGDFVMSGGEVAVLAVVETVARLLPGVLGNAESLTEESHVDGLLEYPVYTKPPSWRGLEVPEVLLSGDHRRIAAWRRERALDRTAQMRPDLVEALDPATLQPSDIAALAALGWSVGADGRFRRDVPPVAH